MKPLKFACPLMGFQILNHPFDINLVGNNDPSVAKTLKFSLTSLLKDIFVSHDTDLVFKVTSATNSLAFPI